MTSTEAKNARIEEEIFNRSLRVETDEDINEAVRSWCAPLGWVDTDSSVAYYWHHREGAWYQADLEAHVANWRKPAPDYCHDLNLCVNELQPRLEELGLWHRYEKQVTKRYILASKALLYVGAEARVDAALAAWDAAQQSTEAPND